MSKQVNKSKIRQEEVLQYEMLEPILDSLFIEIKELSKKKQDGVLNETKVKMVNRVLTKIKALLANDPTNEFLDLLDEEKPPTNSDAVLILAQFQTAMEQFKRKHWNRGAHTWDILHETS
ncbi:hypothetical protein A4D02_35435 [Niastella koreensis]|uniref:Uncharacterized protein n=2 Tax=Niastella koreensis TaxID=354356 RepID=G8TJG6_NIAKG|nr:hypothetical protein [Niastella koreensis]AEV99701.1 hypothetical protein Niako_3395 [Niastella koreensis GR20-10]OQP44272.1 hypothetical protein A4D02_35435 [Niastella koreensis]